MNWLKHRLTLYSIKKANEIDKLSRTLQNMPEYKNTFAYKAEVSNLEWKRLQLDMALLLLGKKK